MTWTISELKKKAVHAFTCNYWKCVLACFLLSFVGGVSNPSMGGNVSFNFSNSFPKEEKQEKQRIIKELYREIIQQGDCLTIKNLAVTGNDLIQNGMKPGKEIGVVLQKMLEEVLENPSHNTREYLLGRNYI